MFTFVQHHQHLYVAQSKDKVGNLQNWDMGASSCGAAPPLELSFCTWVGGTGLCDWPVARYIACTQRILSCSSSLAKITVSPSFTALKKVRPPSRPKWWTDEEVHITVSIDAGKQNTLVQKKNDQVGGPCSPQCSHQVGGAPLARPSSLCSCTWQRCTDSPAAISKEVKLVPTF